MVRPYCVSAVLVHALMEIDRHYPELSADQGREEHEAKQELLAEEPRDPAPPATAGARSTRYLVEQGPARQGEDRLVVALAPQAEQLERNGVAPVTHRA
jgi:hypothetical protein